MNTYTVHCRTCDTNYTVMARDEWSAVRKAAGLASKRRRPGPVTWHGTHAACEGLTFNRPVQIA